MERKPSHAELKGDDCIDDGDEGDDDGDQGNDDEDALHFVGLQGGRACCLGHRLHHCRSCTKVLPDRKYLFTKEKVK